MTNTERDNLLVAIAHALLALPIEKHDTHAWAQLQAALEIAEGKFKKKVM